MNQTAVFTDDAVEVKLLFFAKAREIVGVKELFVKVPSKIIGKQLLNFIIEKFNLNCLNSSLILALNEDWIDLENKLYLKANDEVAIIPPLSGGNIIILFSYLLQQFF